VGVDLAWDDMMEKDRKGLALVAISVVDE